MGSNSKKHSHQASRPKGPLSRLGETFDPRSKSRSKSPQPGKNNGQLGDSSSQQVSLANSPQPGKNNGQSGDSSSAQDLSEDLWTCAHEELRDEDSKAFWRLEELRKDLEKLRKDGVSTKSVVEEVEQKTVDQLEEYNKTSVRIPRWEKDSIALHDVGKKIVTATDTYKHIAQAGVSLDFTGHAAPVWAVLYLGITVSNRE